MEEYMLGNTVSNVKASVNAKLIDLTQLRVMQPSNFKWQPNAISSLKNSDEVHF